MWIDSGGLANALGCCAPNGGIWGPGPAGATGRPGDRIAEDEVSVLGGIISASLRRGLSPEERAACAVALDEANLVSGGEPTLPDVVDALFRPTAGAAAKLATDAASLARASREAALELQRLCQGDLKGMFDGPTSGVIDLSTPLVSFDLSAVYQSEALAILMVCAAAWLQRALAKPEPVKRILT